MKKPLKKIWHKIKYDQKKEWDKIAYSYLKKYEWILDVGCGEGRFIAQNLKKIKGIDLNKESLKICQKKNYQVTKSDARSLSFKNKSVPAVHCSHLIEHFKLADVHKILSEINRVLKPGGTLVIRAPLMWSGFYDDLTHVKPYNPEVIIHYLTPGQRQRTLKQISESFQVIHLKWRYQPLKIGDGYLTAILHAFNRWGFPWLKKNGYLLVLKKND